MPVYYINGHPFINFGVQKNHLGLYGNIPEIFKDKLVEYKCTKDGIQFLYKKPIPYKLIAEIVKYKAKKTVVHLAPMPTLIIDRKAVSFSATFLSNGQSPTQ